MRVGIIVKEFPPDSIGGLQTQTKRMASAIAESSSETGITVFTKRYRKHDDSDHPFEVVRVPHLSVSPFISDLTFLVLCFFALLRYSRKIDCMQCMTIYPIGFLGLMFNRVTGVPYFAWIRGNDFYQMRHIRWKRWMIRRVLSDTRVLVQSPDIESDVRKYFSDLEPDIGVLGNGVTLPEEPASLDSKIVLFVGRLAPKKGVQYLIKAMAKASSDATLWIVGDGAKRQTLESLGEELDVDVVFHGEVSPNQVDHFYCRASIFVLPSTEGEGMPNAVLEAMAYGLPVITTRSGGLSTVIENGETGFFVPMRDPDALAKQIKTLLSNKTVRKRIGNNARKYVREDRSWDALVRKLEEEYTSLQRSR